MLGLDFHLISIYCLHRALYKIHTWKLFVYGKIFARGKIKIEGYPRRWEVTLNFYPVLFDFRETNLYLFLEQEYHSQIPLDQLMLHTKHYQIVIIQIWVMTR